MHRKQNIPFNDLKSQYQSIQAEIDHAIKKVIMDCAYIRGPYVEQFEAHFATFCNASHCIGVGNGTDAIYLALKALGIGPGDEVVVPANTFIATAEAVTLTGAQVVFVDCDPVTYNMDMGALAAAFSHRTRAVIPVHLYGHPVDMDSVKALSHKHGAKIVQDCAQAHGAMWDGHHLAEYGDALCFSFFPGKNLGAYGDAGAVVTNDETVDQKVRMLANHGRADKYGHMFEGVNSRMDGIQGAVLDVKLKYLEAWTERRHQIAGMYDRLLAGVGDIKTPVCGLRAKHVYHLYVIRTNERDGLRTFLKEEGIASGIHYPLALPNLPAYSHLKHSVSHCATAVRYQEQILSLPIFPEMTDEMVNCVADAVARYYRKDT